MRYFIFYLIIINVFSLGVMYYDKRKARKHEWRVSENRLFLFAAILGSVGIWSGMYFFRHKTHHMKFVIGVPAILLIQVFLIYKLIIS